MENKVKQTENKGNEKKIDLIKLDDYVTYLEHINANLRCIKYSMSDSIQQKGLHVIDVELDETIKKIRAMI